MLSVVREQIIKEAQKSDFLSIRQMRQDDGVQERFFEVISLQSARAETIATALSELLA